MFAEQKEGRDSGELSSSPGYAVNTLLKAQNLSVLHFSHLSNGNLTFPCHKIVQRITKMVSVTLLVIFLKVSSMKDLWGSFQVIQCSLTESYLHCHLHFLPYNLLLSPFLCGFWTHNSDKISFNNDFTLLNPLISSNPYYTCSLRTMLLTFKHLFTM